MASTVFSWRHLAVCEHDKNILKPINKRYSQYFKGSNDINSYTISAVFLFKNL